MLRRGLGEEGVSVQGTRERLRWRCSVSAHVEDFSDRSGLTSLLDLPHRRVLLLDSSWVHGGGFDESSQDCVSIGLVSSPSPSCAASGPVLGARPNSKLHFAVLVRACLASVQRVAWCRGIAP